MSYFGWENEALPLGNGKIGAKVFGGIKTELIHFNEKTLWSGGQDVKGYDGGIGSGDKGKSFREIQTLLDEGKDKEATARMKELQGDMTGFGAYQSFCNLYFNFAGSESADKYVRDLDLDTASAMVSYKEEKTTHTRHYFVSYP
ncbi:MAG: glycoside hydrolase N-terminal domain-containing protein, partial [Clostridia bacterium]|nr:glycoside hydrolase N-terminal domain-containing protein [Clostridia bacterium]